MAEEDRKTYLEFIETPVFTDRITKLTSKETLYALQSDLLEEPTRWPVIQGTHGARKGRIADPEVRRGAKAEAFVICTCSCRTWSGSI